MDGASGYSTAGSTLHNLSAGQLADELGATKADIADLSMRADALKAELLSRKVVEAEGALFRAAITETLRQTLDTKAIRAEMGESWCNARSQIAIVVSIKVSARTGTKHAA